MGSLVVEGDMGFAQLVAAVSYFDREWDGMSDITNYAHYWASGYCHDSNYTPAYIDANPQYFPYYTSANVWANPDTGYVVWWPVYCQGDTVGTDFYSSYPYIGNDDKLTAELRLSSQGDTFDWLVGAYYEESKDSWLAPFATPTDGGPDGTGANNLYQQSISLQYWEWYFTNYYGTPTTLPNATSHWSSGSQTDWEQTAIFGEVTWHISDELNLTVGGRYFDRSNENFYFVNHPGGTHFNEGEPDTATPDIRAFRVANDLKPFGRKGEEDKFIPKVSLSYAIGDDKMVYGLYTQGARQGGVNRTRGQPFFANNYESDLMNNYEMGYKSNFADGRGRFNVTAYYMLWEDYQLSIVDPSQEPCPDPNDEVPGVCGQPWQQVIANLGEAHIQGVNVEIDYALSDNWLLGMNLEEIEAETDTAHDLSPEDEGEPVVNELVKGLRLPLVPDYKASAWIEYRMPTSLLGGEEFFVRTQWSRTGDSLNLLEPLDPATEPNGQFRIPGYTIGDIRAGIVGDDWQVDVFVNNVTDERAQYTYNTGEYEWGMAQLAEGRPHHQSVYVNRPLEFGVRYMKRWGD
jgi:outer membrane receptor protein involved in Fe transport